MVFVVTLQWLEDGKYLASSHPQFDHDVYVTIYNEFIRSIEVVSKEGDLVLWISCNGEYDASKYQYAFEALDKECPANMNRNECVESYKYFRFDAQHFQYFVTILIIF